MTLLHDDPQAPHKKLHHKAFRRDRPLKFPRKKPKTTFCVILIMLKWIKFDYKSEREGDKLNNPRDNGHYRVAASLSFSNENHTERSNESFGILIMLIWVWVCVRVFCAFGLVSERKLKDWWKCVRKSKQIGEVKGFRKTLINVIDSLTVRCFLLWHFERVRLMVSRWIFVMECDKWLVPGSASHSASQSLAKMWKIVDELRGQIGWRRLTHRQLSLVQRVRRDSTGTVAIRSVVQPFIGP